MTVQPLSVLYVGGTDSSTDKNLSYGGWKQPLYHKVRSYLYQSVQGKSLCINTLHNTSYVAFDNLGMQTYS